MTTRWLSGAKVVDLSDSRGNGPFRNFLGVALHVNVDEHGTPDSFWRNNPGQVTPNFQVYKSAAEGGVHQLLPFDWQPWCQIDGNFNYAAIETAGLPGEPLNAFQMEMIAKILRVYHSEMGLTLAVADTPGERGLITHKAGGTAWGGHNCPGTIRTAQRAAILKLVTPSPKPFPVPTKGPHLRHAWPSWMRAGNYFGNVAGPNWCHGGVNAAERGAVKLIQQRFQALGLAPKYSGWADGLWEAATDTACVKWHARTHRTSNPRLISASDWRVLFTY